MRPGGTNLLDPRGLRRCSQVPYPYDAYAQINPAAGEIVWQYQADPKESFFTLVQGGCQELPNGNILISETAKGYAFEITREGEKVWEYLADFKPADPVATVESEQVKRRGAIYRMIRLDSDEAGAFLN